MSTPVLEPTQNVTLYERDFYAWLEQQAVLLKAGRLSDLDVINLTEEIESMGASERREIINRLRVLLMHLLKWQYQPETRSNSWRSTIIEQRSQLEVQLDQSPSLRRFVAEAVAYSYPKARRAAAREIKKPESTFPEFCPYAIEQILDDDFWPGDE